MVDISFNTERNVLNLKPSAPTLDVFQDTIEQLQLIGCHFNRSSKCYEGIPADLNSIIEDLECSHIHTEVSELTRRQVAGYLESLKELKTPGFRIIPRWDCVNFPPLKGLPPNEDYQKVDIARAVNQNRFLFNWDMGLGKSFALAVNIETLWYYNLIGQVLIFSSRSGVYNLKDELCNFCKHLTPDDVYVINSITETEDRDIFNKEKYPYKVVIMPYDTFVNINDYYYDIKNCPKRLPGKIAKAEEEFKELTRIKREYYKSTSKYQSTPSKDKQKLMTKLLKEDEEYYLAKKNLSSLKDGLHPSRKLKNGVGVSCMPLEEWSGGKDIGLFLDECHSLANPKSARFNYFKINLQHFNFRYLFTGTLADKYEKLYAALYILDRQLVEGRSYTNWIDSFGALGTSVSPSAINPNNWDAEKIANVNAKLLSTYGAKRLARECLDLPLDYDVPTYHIEMSPIQREIYEGFVKEQLRLAQEKSFEEGSSSKDKILNMFGIFQLAVDNPSCIMSTPSFEKFPKELQEKIEEYNYAEDCTKLKVAKDILADRVDEEGERGIVWYYHPLTKDTLVEELKKYNPTVIEAGLSPLEMNERIKAFKANPKSKIIIASINIMNTSVTVVECTFNIYIERTFNFTDYEQSRRRTWRNGQKNVVRYYFTSYNNSIDNLQLENLSQKGAILNTLMNKEFIDSSMWKQIFNCTGKESWN